MAFNFGGGYTNTDTTNKNLYVGEGFTTNGFYSPIQELMKMAWGRVNQANANRNFFRQGFRIGGVPGPGWYQNPVTGKWEQRNGQTTTGSTPGPRGPSPEPPGHGGSGGGVAPGETPPTRTGGSGENPNWGDPPATPTPGGGWSGGTGSGGTRGPATTPPATTPTTPAPTAPTTPPSTPATPATPPVTPTPPTTPAPDPPPTRGTGPDTGNYTQQAGYDPYNRNDATARTSGTGGKKAAWSGEEKSDTEGGGTGGPDNDVPTEPPTTGSASLPSTPEGWGYGETPPTFGGDTSGGNGGAAGGLASYGEGDNNGLPGGMSGYYLSELAAKGYDPEVESALRNSTMAAVGNKTNAARSDMSRRLASAGTDAGYFGAMSDLGSNEAAMTEEAARQNVLANQAEKVRRNTLGETGINKLSDQEREDEQFWTKLFGTMATKPRETTGETSGINLNLGFGI